MSGGYYFTAEPVGVCSCHACTCPGCHACDPSDEENDMPEPCPTCHGIGLVAVFEGDVPVDERCGSCGGTGERSDW